MTAHVRSGRVTAHVRSGKVFVVPTLAEVGNDAGDKNLEVDAPPVFGGIPGAMPLDHPSQVAGLRGAQNEPG